MAITPVLYESPQGTSPTLYLFALGSDTVANTGGDAGTEQTNRTGFFLSDVTEALVGTYLAIAKIGTTTVWSGYAEMVDTIDQVVCKDYSIVDGTSDVYHADIDVVFNDGAATPEDEYTISWFKNGIPITSGITVPTIQVVQQSNAADLVASSTPTQIGAIGVYKHTETTNRMSAGSAYIAVVTATIDGATRTWRENEGRDNVV